jgi:hypothetical protein
VVITGGDFVFFLLFRDSFLLFLINRFKKKWRGNVIKVWPPSPDIFEKKAHTINVLRRIFPRKRKSFYKEYYKQINRFLTFLL